MRKKTFAVIFCILLLGLAIYSYLFLYDFKEFKNNSAIKGIPTNASVILQIDKPKKVSKTILSTIDFRQDAKLFGWYNKFDGFLQKIDSSQYYTSLLNVLDLTNRELTISLHKEGKGKTVPLVIYKLNNKIEEDQILDVITEKLINVWNITSREYTANTIFKIEDDYLKFEWFCAVDQGLLICSQSSLLVENSLRQMQTGMSLIENPTFNKIIKTAGANCDANLFVNFYELPEILKTLFKNNGEEVNFLKKIGEWGEFDLNINSSQVNVNGFIYPTVLNRDFGILFKNISASRSSMYEVIPSDLKFLLTYNIENSSRFYSNFKDYLKKIELNEQYSKELKKYLKGIGSEEFEKEIFNMIDEEFGLIYLNGNTTELNDNSLIVIQTNSKSKSLDGFKKINQGKEAVVASYYKLDDDTQYKIYQNQNSKSINTIFKYLFPDTPTKYYAFYDNYLLFGNSVSSVKSFIYSNVLKKTLNNSKYFEDFSENYSYKENVFCFIDLGQLNSFLADKSDFSLFSPNKDQLSALSNFYGLGIQGTKAKDLMYVNTCLKYLPVRESEPRTIWQSGLDSTIFFKPSLVENHYTKEKEILVQDKANNLYLIANNGKILWKKKIESPILSEIFQIDFYRNNKLQYLFNTEDRLYLLDRNGNFVDKYPVNFPHQATNGIALIDYDNNRRYRIFVAFDNKETMVFDKTGKRIMGWKAAKTEGKVSLPIQHFRMENKDYIVFSDDKRNYILNRRGEERVGIKSKFIRNANSLFYQENNTIVTSDVNGNVRKIKISDGSVSKVEILKEETNHYFTCSDITKSNGKEYVFVTDKMVLVFNNSGKEEFSKKIDGKVFPMADIYQFSRTNRKIGLFDEENNKIYLINNDGSVYRNFPLKGLSRFSIGFLTSNSNHFNLIVGGANNFLYNYRVE